MQWRIKSLEEASLEQEQTPLRRTIGAWQLMFVGIGAIIGTGIFVLIAIASQLAGPGMILSFVISAVVCALVALCYAEMSALVSAAGSAYSYVYVGLGEPVAWLVGWSLVLEYTLAAGALSVGWSGYMMGLLEGYGVHLPADVTHNPFDGGVANIPAATVVLLVAGLLVLGTRLSFNLSLAVVGLKLLALALFIGVTLPRASTDLFEPFAPTGAVGISAAASAIFFAFIGFDAIATAAEETRRPQRDVPVAIIGSLLVCTLAYICVAAGAIGTVGAQPLIDAAGSAFDPGSPGFAAACRHAEPNLSCSSEPLAFVLDQIGHQELANIIGGFVIVALPTVLLVMIFGQSRIFYAMARDGLLPTTLSRVHSRFGTPWIVSLSTGSVAALLAAFLPLGRLVELSNAGTLIGFMAVSLAALVLRVRRPEVHRPFRVGALGLVAPLAASGSLYLLWNLSATTQIAAAIWAGLGLAVYLAYGLRHGVQRRNASARARS